MMGLRESAYYLSWLLSAGMQAVVTSFLISMVLYRSVFEFSNKGLVFLFFLLFNVDAVVFAFFLTCFFYSARTASTAGPIIFFLSFLPGLIFDSRAGT